MNAPQQEIREIKPQKYRTSIYCGGKDLDEDFVKAIKELESALKMPVWALIQNPPPGDPDWTQLNNVVFQAFLDQIDQFEQGKPVALLIDSPGGDARFAYKLARILNVRCGEYIVVIPSFAKSAATLLSLGASRIVLGPYAELGPLDMQIDDPDREESGSALNHVQTLERLSAFALRTMDQTMLLMLRRTSKKISNILPQAMEFASSLVRPLLENLDVVKYTEMARILKVGEVYAERLLRRKYGRQAAEIAGKLVTDYPEHGFVIEHSEAKTIGLDVESPSSEVAQAITKLLPFINDLTVIGRLQTVPGE
jgi:hypothetical protein